MPAWLRVERTSTSASDGQRVADRGEDGVGARAGRLDHLVARIVDHDQIVAQATSLLVRAGAGVEAVIAVAADQ